jgi:hypothetical protein
MKINRSDNRFLVLRRRLRQSVTPQRTWWTDLPGHHPVEVREHGYTSDMRSLPKATARAIYRSDFVKVPGIDILAKRSSRSLPRHWKLAFGQCIAPWSTVPDLPTPPEAGSIMLRFQRKYLNN